MSLHVRDDYNFILTLSLNNTTKTAMRQPIYDTSIMTPSPVPVFNVSNEKLTIPVKIFANRKNPSWLKSTADTKHTLECLTSLVLSS